MAQRVVLHIGAMKSGTTFIQDRLFANQEVLREQGILVPGRRWRDQALAVSDVLEHTRVGPVSSEGKWERLCREVEAWPGTAVISMEFLGPATPRKIRKVVDSFSGADLEVVLTVRDLNRSIPAMWQETVQNYRTWTWEAYRAGARLGPRAGGGAGQHFWRQQDTPGMARRWVDAVGPEHFTVVTVPRPGAAPDVLWDRFCEVSGIAPGSCAPGPRSNESLGAASALVMRRLNQLLQDRGMQWKDYTVLVKVGLSKNGLAKRKSAEPALGLPVQRWVRRRSKRLTQELEKLGVRVVGDLRDLEPVPVEGVQPADVSDAEQLDAAIVGLGDVLESWAGAREKGRSK